MKGNKTNMFHIGNSRFKMLLLVAMMTLAEGYAVAEDETHQAPIAGTTYTLYPGKRIGFENKGSDSAYHNGFAFPDNAAYGKGTGTYLDYIKWDYAENVNWFSVSDKVDLNDLPVVLEMYAKNVRKGAEPSGSIGVIRFWIDKDDTAPDFNRPHRTFRYEPDISVSSVDEIIIYMIPGDKLGYRAGYGFTYNGTKMSSKDGVVPWGEDLTWNYDGYWNWITARKDATSESEDGFISSTQIQISENNKGIEHHVIIRVYDTREHAEKAKMNDVIYDNHADHDSEITVKPGYTHQVLWGTNWKNGTIKLKTDSSLADRTNKTDGWYFVYDGDTWNYFSVLPGYTTPRTFEIKNESNHSIKFNVQPADVSFEYKFKYDKNNSLNDILTENGVRSNPAIGDSPILNVVSTDLGQTNLVITKNGDDYILNVKKLYKEPIFLAVYFENGSSCEIKTTGEDMGFMWDYNGKSLSALGITEIAGNFNGLIADEDALKTWNVVKTDGSDPSYNNRPLGYNYVVSSRTPNSNLGRVQFNGRIYYFYAAATTSNAFASSTAAATHLPNIQGTYPVICWFENENHEKVMLTTVCVGNEGADALHPWEFGGTSMKQIYTNCGAKEKPDGTKKLF